MKKILLFIFALCLISISTITFAADEGYEFNLTYEGEVIANEAKAATVTLSGTDATPYTNVRIKVELSGPATPTLLATDSTDTQYDIAQIGYWGPPGGFAVGGTFTNETPITATYPEAGTYVTKLSLVNVNNSEAVITSKEFTITVKDAKTPEEDEPNNEVPENNVPENVTPENNVIENIPQAGISLWAYVLVVVALLVAIWAVIYFVKNKND